ncbi:MAG: hypothetical protein ACKO0M_06165 [Cyanobium sp.]
MMRQSGDGAQSQAQLQLLLQGVRCLLALVLWFGFLLLGAGGVGAAPLMQQPAASLARAEAPVPSAALPESVAYRCGGDALSATVHGGAVDDPSIPNRSAGTLPGAVVQLHWWWQGETLALQLPRTNNAGPPSFTDGRWWWSLEDPAHPRFRLLRARGDIQDFACEAV